MPQLTEYEKQREANIAKNLALLEELELKEAAAGLGFPASKPKAQSGAKPVQSTRPKKRKATVPLAARRQSSRLHKPVVNPNETREEKRKREAEEEERHAKETEERLWREEEERAAKRPRHQDLDLSTLGDDMSTDELADLTATLGRCARRDDDERGCDLDDGHDDDASHVAQLKQQFAKMKIVSRAKVTQDRVYCALYHPEQTKDLIFFGDKHGQLSIWDALAPQEEILDEDGDIVSVGDEGGKIFRLQPHWPATSKSSISCIKLDPLDRQNIFSSAYDCTLRSLSFESGVCRELFSLDDILICSFDMPPNGHELWISDAEGGLTHSDLRESKRHAHRYQLSEAKIGCVSVNPLRPEALLVSSNNKLLKLWDARKLTSMPMASLLTPPPSSPLGPRSKSGHRVSPTLVDSDAVKMFLGSKQGKGSLLAEWPHKKSVSSAYWDPSGRRIVSTSYDDTIRLWHVDWAKMMADKKVKGFRPSSRLNHNCQTGKWLTILKSQWNQNPNVYPHFMVGNMNHSLNIIAATGEVLATLSDPTKITAVQAVTCSHPRTVARVASGNASGRCVLWAPTNVEA